MTDVERLAVALEAWSRKGAVVVRGMRIGPMVIGALAMAAMVGGSALKPMFG